MDLVEIYQIICEIFQKEKINYDLMIKLNQGTNSNVKTTLKIYLLQFLFDQEDTTAHIGNKNDIWFIKENPENINMINKYIIILNNLIKKDDISNIDITKEIESFIDTDIGTQLIYIISILNKFNLPNIIYLQFLGFIIGEKKDFIKRNYLLNLQNLIKQINQDVPDTHSKINIYSTSENSLELLNLYIFFKKFLNKEKGYIFQIKNDLNTADDSQDFNKLLYYYTLIKEKLLDKLFFKEENNITSDIYIKKVKNLKQVIKSKVEGFIKSNKNLFEDGLPNNEESLNETNEMIELKEEDEGGEEEEMKKKKEGENKIIFNDNKINNSLLLGNIKSNNDKSLVVEKEINAININSDIESNNIKKNGENNIHDNETSKKDLFNERPSEIIINNSNTFNKLTETKNDKEKNEINFNDNINRTYVNNREKNEKLDTLKNLDKINDYINYPSIKQLNIQEKEEDNQNNKDLFIFRIALYINNLAIKKERLNYILKSSIFDIISEYMKIIDDSKFRILEIANLRLEILINLIKNPNIINIKIKLIEVMIFHLYL